MMAMQTWLEVLLGTGAIGACFLLIWDTGRRARRKKTALFVLNGEKAILEAKISVLTELLYNRVVARGFAGLRSKNFTKIALQNEKLLGDAVMVHHARLLGADYVLVVSMDDLSCQVDESRMAHLAALRVNTTLCVAYQIREVASGRVLAGQTLALCRMTPPIVSGTSVGSDILDKLLGEAADRIAEHLGSLRLAA
jgi:hypothetical protein